MDSLLIKNKEMIIHFLMIFNGGLMGGYAMILRDNFGNAMTGNLMQLLVDVSLKDMSMVLSRLGALLIYVTSFMISTILKNHSKLNMKRITPIVVILGMIIVSCIPATDDIDPVIALYPVFFISAFQWNTFGGTGKYAASTIFISNNTRQFASALAEYLYTKDREYRDRFVFYGMTVTFFCVGVFVVCCLSIRLRQYAILSGIIPMLLTEMLLGSEDN